MHNRKRAAYLDFEEEPLSDTTEEDPNPMIVGQSLENLSLEAECNE